ncbi:site-specific integrase [Roseibium album]|uniref:site-specific integrase n=1 Tax=Roseibium album TaxID=311410 RepID=UPI00248F503A|nr:site-specific integrase [Roseibium album]
MAGHPRLYRRGATYYHRAAIPRDIKTTYPKTEETFSLGTKDYQEALRLVRQEAVKVDRRFDEHRLELSKAAQPALEELSQAQIDLIGDIYYAFLLEEDEELREEGFESKSFEEHADDIEMLGGINRNAYARGEDTEGFFRDEAEEVLSWTNVDLKLNPQSKSWRKLIRKLQTTTLRASEDKKARNRGDVVETPQVTKLHETRSVTTPLLSEAVSSWIREKSRASWGEKTADDHRIWADRFVLIVGDRPIQDYAKTDGRAFKDVLLKLPPNWTRQPDLQDLSIKEAAERAETLKLKPMSIKNYNKIIGFVAAFWNWAKLNYDEIDRNPLDGLKLRNDKAAFEERDPFTSRELNQIFRAPLYTGCKSRTAWLTAGNHVPDDLGLYWVPLLSLFTGARSGELIQLYVDDIKDDNGIMYLDINKLEDDKRLKTKGSRRRLPLHNMLLDLGFLHFVDDCKMLGRTRLFPEMRKGNDGYYSSPFSRQFRRLLESVGAKTKRNAFHSFRHTFEDACRDSSVPREVMYALQGHEDPGMGDRYGSGYALTTLNEHLQKVSYPELELSHPLTSLKQVAKHKQGCG